MTSNLLITEKVAEIYEWLDLQIENNKALIAPCSCCGRCCNFDAFGHLLFVTTQELVFLKQNLKNKNMKKMQTSRCPYNEQGKCSIHPFRFAGCRIFYCKGNADFQNELSESVLEKLKSLCEKFDVPYCYTDIKTALNTLTNLEQ